MKAITTYLKGVEPFLVTHIKNLESSQQSEESQSEITFIKSLLKEIAELPAIEKGDNNGTENSI